MRALLFLSLVFAQPVWAQSSVAEATAMAQGSQSFTDDRSKVKKLVDDLLPPEPIRVPAGDKDAAPKGSK